ncbi:MAG: hypothetical protein ACTHU0_40090 [Kofleriaceae bacterium]
MNTSSTWIASLGLAMAAACGNSAHTDPDATPNPDAPAPAAGTIRVTTTTAPALIAFRDGPTAAWQTPTEEAPGRYAFDVHGPYEVTVVCRRPGALDVHQRARTLDDAIDLAVPCPVPAPPTHAVTGTMKQSGILQLGPNGFDNGGGNGQPWQFEIQAPAGTFDLLAMTTDWVKIVRGIEVAGPTAVPGVLDVDGTGVRLVPVPFEVTNEDPTHSIGIHVSIETPSTSRMYVSTSGETGGRQVPASALLATDLQLATVVSGNATVNRTIQRPLSAGTTFTLLPQLTGVTLAAEGGQVTGSWTNLPPNDVVQLSTEGFSDDFATYHTHTKQLTAAFLAATGAHAARLETDQPGFDPSWRIGLDRLIRKLGVIVLRANDEIATSELWMNPTFAPPSIQSERAHRIVDALRALRRTYPASNVASATR